MNSVVEAFRGGGVWMYLILAVLLLGLPLGIVAGVLAALRRRAPWLLCGGLALVALILGALGQVLGLAQVVEAVGFATPEQRGMLVAMGAALSLYPRAFGGLAAFVMAGLAAWALGIGGAIGTGSPREKLPGTAIVTITIGAVTMTALALLAVRAAHTGHASAVTWLLVAAPMLLSTPCAMIGASRGPTEQDMTRQAAQHLGAGALAMLAAAGLALGAYTLGQLELLAAMSHATSMAETRERLIIAGEAITATHLLLGALGVGGAALYGVLPALPRARRAMDSFGVFSGLVSGAMVLLTLLAVIGAAQHSAATLDRLGLSTARPARPLPTKHADPDHLAPRHDDARP